jgi:hypothetical protein
LEILLVTLEWGWVAFNRYQSLYLTDTGIIHLEFNSAWIGNVTRLYSRLRGAVQITESDRETDERARQFRLDIIS